MSDINDFYIRPLKLMPNRVYRPFTGGKLLDEWQGKSETQDGQFPEEWVASTVLARSANPILFEGLSKIVTGDNTMVYLKDLVEANPRAVLGEKHTDKFGVSTALLVKVLDSCSRLLIQVHPDKNFAKKAFQSEFGKTEAWYIIGGRSIHGENPYVMYGFKPGITREKWIELFETQNIEGMIATLHRFEVKPGDVFLVEGGIPHAAGAGVFFIEVQEPTDYTIRTERKSPHGMLLSEDQLHQGLGFEKMFDCFHYQGYRREEISERWYLQPRLAHEDQGGKEFSVIPPERSAYFSMERLEVRGKFSKAGTGSFAIAIVLSGSGYVYWEQGGMRVEQASEIFLPAGLPGVTWQSLNGTTMVVILCHPPMIERRGNDGRDFCQFKTV